MSENGAIDREFTRASTRIGFNLAALVGSRFVGLALTLVQMAIIFRALNVVERGQFGFALQYASLYTVFATLGIQRLLVRDIARDPESAWTQTWTATAVCVVLSIAVQGLVMITTIWTEDSPGDRLAVAFAASWVVLLWAWQRPFESLLVARERMELVALVNVGASVLKIVTAWLSMRIAPSSASAHAGIAAATLVSFLLCVGIAFRVGGWERPRIRLAFALAQIRECYPFAIAMLLSLAYFKSDMSLLKFLHGEEAAGYYTPPQRVMEPLLMIAGLWGTAVFPALCRFSHAAPEHFTQLKKTSLRFALLVAFPMACGLALLAQPIVDLLTGNAQDAKGSVPVLQILAAMMPFFYVNGIGQEFFYSTHRNWFVVAAYAVGAFINLAGNVLVIPAFGSNGAAVVAVVTNAVISGIFLWGFRSEFGELKLPTLLVKIGLACACMCAPVAVLGHRGLVLPLMCGVAAYPVALAVLRVLDETERALILGVLRSCVRRRG